MLQKKLFYITTYALVSSYDNRSQKNMVHNCAVCSSPAEKRCSGCSVPWYCGKECQEYHWIEHIFDCNVKRNINTADRLSLAVRRNIIPEDAQTREDYGFSRLRLDLSEESKLLGLYIGLMERLQVKPKILNRWKDTGTLVQGIKDSFEQLPSGSRGGYYPWFLENQWILSSPRKGPEEPYTNAVDNMVRTAWIYAGGSPMATEAQIKDGIQKFSENKQQCLFFCGLILSHLHPGPLEDVWIPFGFCTCDAESEMYLGGTYRRLLQSCTFDEFLAAYESSELVQLFKSKGLEDEIFAMPFLEGVLDKSPYMHFSVWDLKQLIIASETEKSGRIIPSVFVDYGFANCRDEEETENLKAVYKTYFGRDDADPPALHGACIKGELVEYIDKFVKLKGKKKYRRLMKNPYPLRNI